MNPFMGAPSDIAGKDAANPIGMIASGAMMLRHSFGMGEEADLIENAIQAVLGQGCRTGRHRRRREPPSWVPKK